MPITLITGLPGHGKTLYTLQWVQDLAMREGRAVFQHGIRDLKLPWQEWKPDEWEQLEPGSILVIDECQSVFPVRGRGQPPAWIEELAKHRHKGVDLVVITQNPMLMDSFVRRLVDRHFHVVRVFGAQHATVHEFPNGVKDNVATSREGSIRHEWRYPVKLFDAYKSAELHTIKRRVPMRVYLLFGAPFVFLGLAWFAFQRLVVAPQAPAVPPQSGPLAASGLPDARVGAAVGGAGRDVAPDYLASFSPRVAGLDYTAPVYDEVTKPAYAPYPAACVAMGSRCECYSQQGTRLVTPESLCRGIVAGGFFVAWDTGRGSTERPSPVASYAPPGAVVGPAAVGINGALPRPASKAASAGA